MAKYTTPIPPETYSDQGAQLLAGLDFFLHALWGTPAENLEIHNLSIWKSGYFCDEDDDGAQELRIQEAECPNKYIST